MPARQGMRRGMLRVLSRRRFVQRLVAAGAMTLSGSELLAACGQRLGSPASEPLQQTPSIAKAMPTVAVSVSPTPAATDEIDLPPPRTEGKLSLEEALAQRRSVRSFYRNRPLNLQDIAQLFWAAQGVTRGWGGRTAPSAGALYPLEAYAATSKGVYRYLPADHRAETRLREDVREALWTAGLSQEALTLAAAIFVISAVYERTAQKYGGRAERYVKLEAGHAAQNLLLQAVALNLGAVVIGAFHDQDVAAALGLAVDEEPLYLIPVGHPMQ
jgi:SagB-type dehydrogenase family enzyme